MLIFSKAPPRNRTSFAYESTNLEQQSHVRPVLQHVPQLTDNFFYDNFNGLSIGVAHFGNGGVVDGLNWTSVLIVFEGRSVLHLHQLVQVGPATSLFQEMFEYAELYLLLLCFSEATKGVRGEFERRRAGEERLIGIVGWEEDAKVRKLDGLPSELADGAHVLRNTAPGQMIQLQRFLFSIVQLILEASRILDLDHVHVEK